MIQDAQKYLKERKVDDIEVEAKFNRIISDINPIKFSISELMDDYEQEQERKFEITKFTIDIRKPQFKWFLLLVLFCIIGIAFMFIQFIKLLIYLL